MKLLEKTEIDFDETSLVEAVEMIKEMHEGIPVVIDQTSLDLAGVSADDDTVTLALSGTTLRSALRMMLKSLDLTYLVTDGILVITTIEEAEQRLNTEVYPVVDLVDGKDSTNVARSADMLMELLVRTVSPETWESAGGMGSLSYFRGQLVVAQTQEVHGNVVTLLEKLRKSIKASGGLELPLPGSNRNGGSRGLGRGGLGGRGDEADGGYGAYGGQGGSY